MARPNKSNKPAVAFYDLTGCNGCLLSFLFNEEELLDLAAHIDIKAFRFVKEIKDDKQLDIAFVEGLVASNDDLDILKSVRSRAKVLVAFGSCACTGCIPAYRNFIDPSKYSGLVYEKLKELRDMPATPIKDYVTVDHYIPGCPPDKKQVLNFIKDVLLGKTPVDYDKPVCFECRLNQNRCLLDDGKMCLGPITRGGCDSICTNGGLECWGCRGPTPDANIPLIIKLLEEKGFTKEHIKQRLRTFAGLMIEKPPKQKMVKPVKIRPKKDKAKKKPAKKMKKHDKKMKKHDKKMKKHDKKMKKHAKKLKRPKKARKGKKASKVKKTKRKAKSHPSRKKALKKRVKKKPARRNAKKNAVKKKTKKTPANKKTCVKNKVKNKAPKKVAPKKPKKPASFFSRMKLKKK